MTYLDTCMQVS